MTDQRGLRMTFDSAAALYQQARPEYPEQLYEAMITAAGLGAGDRLLEIGCASGKATLPLARQGFRITCIEPGAALAAVGRRNLASFPEVEVVQSTFEDIDPSQHEPFDLVFAATAWHWLDPAVRYRRTWELLRPGGHVAFWSATHVFPEGGDEFFAELQAVYDEIGEGRAEGATYSRPGELPDQREDIEASGLFDRSWCATSTGRSPTTLTATSGCSTPSRAISRWSRGSGDACTRKSGADWTNEQTGCSAAAGAPFSTARVDVTSRMRHSPIVTRDAALSGGARSAAWVDVPMSEVRAFVVECTRSSSARWFVKVGSSSCIGGRTSVPIRACGTCPVGLSRLTSQNWQRSRGSCTRSSTCG